MLPSRREVARDEQQWSGGAVRASAAKSSAALRGQINQHERTVERVRRRTSASAAIRGKEIAGLVSRWMDQRYVTAHARTQGSEVRSEGRGNGGEWNHSAERRAAGSGDVGSHIRGMSGKAVGAAGPSVRRRGGILFSSIGSGGDTQNRSRSQRDGFDESEVAAGWATRIVCAESVSCCVRDSRNGARRTLSLRFVK